MLPGLNKIMRWDPLEDRMQLVGDKVAQTSTVDGFCPGGCTLTPGDWGPAPSRKMY